MHGYELRHYLSFLVGHVWTLSYGTLYPALRRLEKRGELTKHTVRDGKGPAKHVYALTEVGEAGFLERLRDTSGQTDVSDPQKFTLRMAFARHMSREERVAFLEARRAFLMKHAKVLSEMGGIPEEGLDAFRRALIRHHAGRNEAELAFVDEALAAEGVQARPQALEVGA